MNIQSMPNKRQYASAWQRVVDIARKTPNAPIKAIAWFDLPAWQVRQDFVMALHRRINTRGQLIPFESRRADDRRVLRELRRRYTHECRWCGFLIPYAPAHLRFCSAECRHCYSL